MHSPAGHAHAFSVRCGIVLLVAVLFLSAASAVLGDDVDIHALVAAAGEGDTVELPAGTHELDRTLVIDKRVTLVGQGPEETVLRAAIDAEGVMLRIQNADGVRLADLALDGANDPRLSQGIVLSGGAGHELDNLHIRDIPGTGGFGPHAIYASSNVTDSRFANMVIRNIGIESEWGAGIRIGEGGRGNLIEHNDLAGFGRGGILTTRGSIDTIIRSNRVRDFGHAGPDLGIEVWGSGERVVIEDNTVDHWISVDGQQDVAVRRNTITGADDAERIGSYGLELVNSQRVVMTDNVMAGGNHIGLSVSNRARKDLAYWARNVIRHSETWGVQIQGEAGGAHRMLFHENDFVGTRRSERSLYPGAAGHGFRFNGNAFQIVLQENRFADNAGAGIQLGGENLDRLSFIGNTIADNGGPAVTGSIDGEALAWENNEVTGNAGGDDGLPGQGFEEPAVAELRLVVTGEPRVGEATTLSVEGFQEESFSAVLWNLGAGVPRSGPTVEYVYDRPGTYRIAAVAWTRSGQAILLKRELTVED